MKERYSSSAKYKVLVAACFLNFIHGCAYIWTMFQPYAVSDFGLSMAQSGLPFTFMIALFPVGNILGGKIQQKIGSSYTILVGNLALCGGFILSAMATPHSAILLSIGYGIIGGISSGIAYGVTVATAQAYFPGRVGLISGATIGIVGISGVIMNPFCDWLLLRYGFRNTLLFVAALYALITVLGFRFMQTPLESGEEQVENKWTQRQFSTSEIIKEPTFYMIMLSMTFLVPAYVILNPIMKSFGLARGLSMQEAVLGVVVASIANIVSRFASPWISDYIGRKQMILINYFLATASILALTRATGIGYVICISAASFSFGGVASVYSAYVVDHFGNKYQASNYGATMIGFGIISLLCPLLISVTEKSRFGIEGAFFVTALLGVIGFFLTIWIPSPKKYDLKEEKNDTI